MSGFACGMMRLAAAVIIAAATASAALARDYQLNDRVQAYVSGEWYDGTIIGLGEGDFAGEYYVDFDDYTNAYYVQAKNLRPLDPPAQPADSQGASL